MAVRFLAVVCYVLALTGLAALAALIMLLGLDRLPRRTGLSASWCWLINVSWLTAFGLQHSVMARAGFKRLWKRIIPPCLERSVYGALSGLLLLGLALTWQPLPGGPFWRGPTWLVAVPLLLMLALLGTHLCFDHAAFFGLRQAWGKSEEIREDQLLIIGPYRYVRHPLTACTLGLLWVQPILSPTLALLSAGLSVYAGIGLLFEERDLLRRFGPAYAAYRARVPALVPWRRPAPAAAYPAVQAS